MPPMDSPAEPHTGDIALDLSFVPAWARHPPSAATPNIRPSAAERDEKPPRHRRDGRRPQGHAPGRERPTRHPMESQPTAPAAASAPKNIPPLDITFLPERHGVAPLARRLALSARAYGLFDVAAMFLSKPEYYAARVTTGNGAPLFQCAACKAIFFDRPAAERHAVDRHFSEHARREERETDPPQGAFLCVARCRLSGEVLGPPNYHGFADRLIELHRTRFSHLPLDRYRQQVETVRDPTVIEQWKQSMRRVTVYRFVEPDGETEFARYAEAEAHFRERYVKPMIQSGDTFVIPGVALEDADAELARRVKDARAEEQRFPLKLSIAVRLAFRRLGLHAFKAGGATFLTAVCPHPIEPETAVENVRVILEHIAAHPGCRPNELTEGLCATEPPDSPHRQDVVRQLRWLVEKGHVIEFADARLAVPRAGVRVQHAKAPPRPTRRRRSHGRSMSPADVGEGRDKGKGF